MATSVVVSTAAVPNSVLVGDSVVAICGVETINTKKKNWG